MDFERERSGGRRFQVIVKDDAIRRIFRRRLFGRQRSFLIVIVTDADGWRGLEKIGAGTQDLRTSLAKGREVIEDPKAAAVGGGNEVIAMYREIANVRRREIELQRLPVVAIIE